MRIAAIVPALVAVYVVIAVFCALTPWIADDWGYGGGSSSLAGIFQAQLEEHFRWSGKFVGHFLLRCLLHSPPWLHTLLTPLVFLCLVVFPVILTFGSRWRSAIQAWHVLFVFGLLWFAIPGFGTVFFWRTGTPDYGYSLFFAMLFLVPFRFLLDDPQYTPWCGPLFFVSGALAGCSNENLGMLAVLSAAAAMLFLWKRTRRIPLWGIAGMAGAVAGWLLMISAPGTHHRLEYLGGAASLPLASAQAFKSFLVFFGSQQLELLPFYLFCLWALWRLRSSRNLSWRSSGIALAFFIMTQMSLGAFILSPSHPVRAMTATFYLICCCAFALAVALPDRGKKTIVCFLAFCLLLACDIAAQMKIFSQAASITEIKESAMRAGKTDITVYGYPHTNKYFFPGYDIREVDIYGRAWEKGVPWERAQRLPVAGDGVSPISAFVSNNIVYLNNVPDGTVYLCYTTHDRTVESLLRQLTHLMFTPPANPVGEYSLNAWYRPSSATAVNGKAAVHARGIRDLSDIAYLAVRTSRQQEVVYHKIGWE